MAESCSSVHVPLELCGLCDLESTNKEASFFCIQCKSFLCDECLKWHVKFPAMKEHKVLEKDELPYNIRNRNLGGQQEKYSNLDTNECQFHPGSKVQLFCVDHHEIICTTCKEEHEKCNTVQIEDYAKEFFKSDIFKEFDSRIGRVQSVVENVIDTFFSTAQNADSTYRNGRSHEAKAFLQKVIEMRVDNSCKDVFNEKRIEADALKSSLQLSLERIYTARRFIDSIHYSDVELFIYMCRVKKDLNLLEEGVASCKQSLGKPWLISFKSDNVIEEALEKIVSYNSTKLVDIDMKQESESSCNITAVEALSRGRFIVGDATNNVLKVYDTKNSPLMKVLITAAPRQLVELKDDVVLMIYEGDRNINAVTFTDGMLKIELFCSFEGQIIGLAKSKCHIAIAFYNHVVTLDDQGQFINKTSVTKNGKLMFSGIKAIDSNKRTGELYIHEASYLEKVGLATDIEIKNKFQTAWSEDAPSTFAIDWFDAVWLCKPGYNIKRLTKDLILLQEIKFESLDLPKYLQSPNTGRKCRFSIACNTEMGLVYLRGDKDNLKIVQIR